MVECGPNNRSLKVWDSLNAIQADGMKGLFEFTPSHIQKLKQYAHSKLKKKDHISAFSVTRAYVLACLVKAQQPKANKLVFIFSVDCRSRLDPPIQPTYFGNCIVGQKVVAETKNLLENDGFISALEGIIKALNRLKDEVLNGIETWISTIFNVIEDKIFATAGSPRFEVYSVDFGWGRPKKVDVTSIDKKEAFSLSESRNNDGGIEIGLVLS
ncbi:Transferase [Sesbania bispinosa]|nr:Transferase [Sesbania bispinosa]